MATQHAEFWATEGLNHIKPEVGQEFPEGFHPGKVITHLADAPKDARFVEFGCGYGRLASAFTPGTYHGVDINPAAIELAAEKWPEHKFSVTSDDDDLPEGDVLFTYTVALHLSDDDLIATAMRMRKAAKKIIIGELMDMRWRRPGNPPVYNRDPEYYIALMQAMGFRMTNFLKLPYERYDDPAVNQGRDSRVSFLLFERQ